MEAEILDGETSAEDILKIFALSVMNRLEEEEENDGEEINDNSEEEE